MSKLVLAADLGGTNLRIAAVDENGQVVYYSRSSMPPSRSREDILQLILTLADECIENTKQIGKVSAFGIAAPAVIEHQSGTLLVAPNLPLLNGFRIADVLYETLKIPVVLENDATAAAIGEHWKGASKGYESSICLTLGTGVGGGLIINGEPLRGIDGTAGEVGHVCVEPFGVPCGCGGVGCLEQYSSATAIVRMSRELLSDYPGSTLAMLDDLTSLDVFIAGKAGDGLGLEVFRRVGFYLGVALAGLINVLNPEAIVIGGGVSRGWELFEPPMRLEVKRRAFRPPAERVKLVLAKLGDDAGIVGVARLAHFG